MVPLRPRRHRGKRAALAASLMGRDSDRGCRGPGRDCRGRSPKAVLPARPEGTKPWILARKRLATVRTRGSRIGSRIRRRWRSPLTFVYASAQARPCPVPVEDEGLLLRLVLVGVGSPPLHPHRRESARSEREVVVRPDEEAVLPGAALSAVAVRGDLHHPLRHRGFCLPLLSEERDGCLQEILNEGPDLPPPGEDRI